jgi:HAD superfamily hydrolase (TIGR01662 family)
MEIPLTFKAYLFDLDNTLYDERDYLFPAYHEIGNLAETAENRNQREIAGYLIETFQREGRTNLFDKMISAFDLKTISLDDCLRVMRNLKPGGTIKLFPGVITLLKELFEKNKIVAVVTNGNVEQQKNKVRLIDWLGLDKGIEFIYANEHGKKPSPASIQYFLNAFSISPSEAVYVGDSEEDSGAARAAGVRFIKSEFRVGTD